MFDRVNQQAFGDSVCHFSHGQVGLGAASLFPNPGSPLHPEVLCANLISMAATAAWSWLAGVIPPVANAVRTPEFEGFPSLLQVALSPQPTRDDAPEMIGFANLINEQGATDAFIGGKERSHKLLAQLQAPGQSQEWSGQSPGEPPVKVRFVRTDEPTDDGSWVMRTDLYHGHELKSSRSTRMHHVCDDDRRPEQFREDVSEGFRACLGRLEQGEDPRIAVVCEDGATFSGAMAVLMQQMHRAHERSGSDRPDAASSPQADQRSSREYQETCRQTLGQGFAKGMEPFLNVGARQPPARFTDAREPNRPPEAMFRSPFVSTQRARDPIVELGDESDKDAGYGSDLSDETTSIAGSDFGGSTRSLSDSLFIEELPSGAHEPTTEPSPARATPKAPPRPNREAPVATRRIDEQAAPAAQTRPSEPAGPATPEAASPAESSAPSTIRKSASMPDLRAPEESHRLPSRAGSDPSLDRPAPRPRNTLRNVTPRHQQLQLQQQLINVQRLKQEHEAAMREKGASQQANVAKIRRELSDSALATPSATTERALEQARKAAMASALAAQKQQQPHLLDSPIPDEPRLPEPMRFTVNRAASDARPASTVELSSPEPDLIDWRDLQEDLDSVAQELSASAPAGMRRVQSAPELASSGVAEARSSEPAPELPAPLRRTRSEPSVAPIATESPKLAARLGAEMQRAIFGLAGREEPVGMITKVKQVALQVLGRSKESNPLEELADGLSPLIADLRQEFDGSEGGRAAGEVAREAFVVRRLRSHADASVRNLSKNEAAGLFNVFGSASGYATQAAEQRANAARALETERKVGGGAVTPDLAARHARLASLDATMKALADALLADAGRWTTR